MAGPILGLVVLGRVRKEAEQARESKEVSIVPLWRLLSLYIKVPSLYFSDNEL